jgi:EAL domain-containing protein (putative c-di-GMP-specific phosphodiesterase class I)
MICLLLKDQKLRSELVQLLNESQITHCSFDPDSNLAIPALYAEHVRAAVVDCSIVNLTKNAWLDMMASLGARIPVFILGGGRGEDLDASRRNHDGHNWLDNPSASQLLALFTATGSVHEKFHYFENQQIRNYSPQLAFEKLNAAGALSILKIDGSGFRKISIDYGIDAYRSLHACFQRIVASLWGRPGQLRQTDIILRKSAPSNIYYVLLEQSRIERAVPAPGVLEMLADRITARLQESLWEEITKSEGTRSLPSCIKLLPDFSIGHATVLLNPCIDPMETIEALFDKASVVAKAQKLRVRHRELELMQTIINSREILVPQYQGVFKLQEITRQLVEDVVAQKSIAPIESALYGFESLIRADTALIDSKIELNHIVHLSSRLLSPDILFAIAGHCKIALELDQVCLSLGIEGAVTLPGKLMVNILPRNLMHLDRLSHLTKARGDLVFEISESEGISNPEQMQKIRTYISNIGAMLAADDFGKGQANIERVIRWRPELIKIDRGLLEKIHLDPAKKVFVEGIVKAAKHIKATVIAEGIETWEEAEAAQQLGIELIQGFLLHRPQPLSLIEAQLIKTDSSEAAA